MSTGTVKDRSGEGMPSKAERRALGKVAAAKRRAAERRRAILGQVGKWTVIVAIPVGLVLATAAAMGAFKGPFTLDPLLDTKPTVTAGEGDVTELKVTHLLTGDGPVITAGQSITVNYVGVHYATGEEFDSSWDGAPVTFDIGVGAVIDGWDQAIVGLTLGSRVQIDIPSELAYGDDPPEGYPAGDLRFVVDLRDAQ